jgi:predicted DNA-binding protein with PD1-like motif
MTTPITLASNAVFHVTRLTPGQDLRKCLQELAATYKMDAAVVVTCIGSLVQYNLRFANQKNGHTEKGYYEIVSLAGTLSQSSAHLHLCIADSKGTCIGGHLLDNNFIYTTAEIVIAQLPGLFFDRIHDEVSGYNELIVRLTPAT